MRCWVAAVSIAAVLCIARTALAQGEYILVYGDAGAESVRFVCVSVRAVFVVAGVCWSCWVYLSLNASMTFLTLQPAPLLFAPLPHPQHWSTPAAALGVGTVFYPGPITGDGTRLSLCHLAADRQCC